MPELIPDHQLRENRVRSNASVKPGLAHSASLAWVRVAAAELGASVSTAQYARWRKKQMDDAGARRRGDPGHTPLDDNDPPLWRMASSKARRQSHYRRASRVRADRQEVPAGRPDGRCSERDERLRHESSLGAVQALAGRGDSQPSRGPRLWVARRRACSQRVGGPSARWPVVIETVLADRSEPRHPAIKAQRATHPAPNHESKRGVHDGAH